MTIWVTDKSATLSADSATIGVRKTRALLIPFSVPGLRPSSEYFFFVNGTDMTWATGQSGTNMGDGLFSDENGKLDFNFYAELNTIESDSMDTITKYHQFQIKNSSGDIQATAILPQTLKVRN